MLWPSQCLPNPSGAVFLCTLKFLPVQGAGCPLCLSFLLLFVVGAALPGLLTVRSTKRSSFSDEEGLPFSAGLVCQNLLFSPWKYQKRFSQLYSLFFNDGLAVASGFFNDEFLLLRE